MSDNSRLEIITLNCWGLKFISKLTTERISHIAERLAESSCDIVCLQEIWQQDHWQLLRYRLRKQFPYAKFYYSGMLGSGLAILSRFPIIQTDMRPYTLNGRPQAFFRGDWFVGKGVASAVINLPCGRQAQIFNTHMHAPYNEKVDTYLCHRTSQGWDLRKLLKASVQAGYITFATGDFNSLPGSLVHRFLTSYLLDTFISLHPEVPLLPTISTEQFSSAELVSKFGLTCDVSPLNTWRQRQAPGMYPKRLDYIFHDHLIEPLTINVIFTELLEDFNCSASDHFGLHCTYLLKPADSIKLTSGDTVEHLNLQDYNEILDMLAWYTKREQGQSQIMIGYFWICIVLIVYIFIQMSGQDSTPIQILCAMIVLLLGITGLLSGLVGFIFGWGELRSLQEFGDEIERAKQLHAQCAILSAASQ